MDVISVPTYFKKANILARKSTLLNFYITITDNIPVKVFN